MKHYTAAARLMFKGADGLGRGMGSMPITRTGDPAAPTVAADVLDSIGVEDVKAEAAVAAAKPSNMFRAMFPAYTFVRIPERKPSIFENGAEKGTKQYGVCDILMHDVSGIEGLTVPGYRIVKRVSPDGKTTKVLCVPPQFSPGGPVKYPYINTKECPQATKDAYSAFLQGIIDDCYVWVKDGKDKGIPLYNGRASSGGAGTVENVVDEAQLEALGL